MTDFKRDWVVHPGATLRDWMEENLIDSDEAARRCSMTLPELNGILSGGLRINSVKACKLQQGTGIAYKFWLNYEKNFREGLAQGRKWTK